ncbi:hypothetical protein GW17_00010983 [Ensete ventricosum]|nr:hypothetical protein GW17_00010983 [Ensete ventricosum]
MKINYVHEFPRRNSPFPGSSETGDPVAVAGDADNEPTLITSRVANFQTTAIAYYLPLSAIGRFSIAQHRSSTSMATKDSAAPLPPALHHHVRSRAAIAGADFCTLSSRSQPSGIAGFETSVSTYSFREAARGVPCLEATIPRPITTASGHVQQSPMLTYAPSPPARSHPASLDSRRRRRPKASVKPPAASPVSKQPSPNPVTEASIDPAAPTRCLSGVVFFLLLLSSSSRVHRQRHQDRRCQAPATVSLPSLTDAATHQQCSCSKGSDSPSHYKQCCLELFGSVTVFTSKCWQSTTITEAKKCAILNTLPRTILPATFSRDRLPLPRSIFPSVGSHLRQRRGKSTSASLSGQIILLRYLGSCSRIFSSFYILDVFLVNLYFVKKERVKK